MAELLSMQSRRGTVEAPFRVAAGLNFIELSARFGKLGDRVVGLRFRLEHNFGGAEGWQTFAGAEIAEQSGWLQWVLETPDKGGVPRGGVLRWRFHEQLVLDPKGQDTVARDYQVHGKTYRQFALCQQMRLVVDTFTPDEKGAETPIDAEYGFDIEIGDRPYPVESIPAIVTGGAELGEPGTPTGRAE